MDRNKNFLAEIAAEFEQAWQSGHRPALQDFLSRVSNDLRSSLLQQLVPLDAKHRQQSGDVVSVDDYRELCESLGVDPVACLSNVIKPTPANQAAQDLDVTGDYVAPEHANGSSLGFVVEHGPKTNTTNREDSKPAVTRIGRYRVERILGKGGFGLVYLAHDEQLNRRVAIKVPHAHLIGNPNNVANYLAEARTVANLDHPHVVPVYDVGSTPDTPCFIVTKFIEGSDLASLLKQKRLSYRQATQWIASIAEALHYAHKMGLVHRDVKPGNILIGKDQQPYVVDFGLALREENIGQGPQYAGTPAYMSPEQARGEGHRVDGRSDIFSLGAVFYELLVGRRAFRGDTLPEIYQQIISYEPKPPRQYDEEIPKELERICQKALAKRATDRYSTAFDLAQDLRLFLQEHAQLHRGNSPATPTTSPTSHDIRLSDDSGRGPSPTQTTFAKAAFAESQPVKIVPKGLRSFDGHDADFFLELLPGPRDREGLPDSLRFWKTRVEATDPDNTFSVGLIYGPSGCGKSSLVKAGLLPRLSADVIAVYVEATPDETETRLLNGLRKRCPALEDNLSLKETLAALRRGQGIPVGKKVLIVLDQFEQWLHAKKEEHNTELVQALRQCDGGRVQCIVMVRDDFWLAASRFLRELEVRLVEGHNIALADLFDLDHARKVLAAFGRAFGKLPDDISDTTNEQKEFVKQSVAGLADEGKVICVRLALYAEMMKGKTWTPATLKEVGGTSGVGVTFLEETFSSSTASPDHRYHQEAARAVLRALLPMTGTDIKGHMRSASELQAACGYTNRTQDFGDLIRILDSEIRLITPTDPEGKNAELDSASQTLSGEKYFQLTHDYLVHSLRDWLTRKQKETRKGRAELLIADRASVWSARPENRQLPSLTQWLQIRCYTGRNSWNEQQRTMMARANRYHTVRGIIASALLIGLIFGGNHVRNELLEQQRQTQAKLRDMENVTRAEELVDSLLKADTSQVPAIVAELSPYRERVDPLLNAKLQAADNGSAEKLHLALALVPVDQGQVDYLRQQLTMCPPSQFTEIRKALFPHKAQLIDSLWQFVQDEQRSPSQRFQTAAALAEYAPDDNRWQAIAPFVAQELTASIPSVYVGPWQELLRPASQQLIAPLKAIHADRSRSEKQRETAAFGLADYLRDQPQQLTDVILVADEWAEFALLIAPLRHHNETIHQRLLDEMQAMMPVELDKNNDQLSDADEQRRLRDAHWKRQSLAAVALVHLGLGDEVWPLLRFTANPSLRSFVIHQLGKLGTDHNVLAARLEFEADVSIRRALIQALGGLDAAGIPPTDRTRIVEHLQELYLNDPDPGIHSSVSWALCQWGTTLPGTSVGEPALSYEQSALIEKLAADADDLRSQLIAMEAELPTRQLAWERQLNEQASILPPSLQEGLVAHYPFDEREGTQTSNLVEGEPVGTYAGPGQPEWVPGIVGNAVMLNGKGGHFVCGEKFRPERVDSFSYGCWFLSRDEGRFAALLAKMDNGVRGFDLLLQDSQRLSAHLIHKWRTNAMLQWSAEPIQAGRWQHAMVTYDGSSRAAGLTIYVDGRAVRSESQTDKLSATIQNIVPLHIGMRNAEHSFRGIIDDVRIYNRLLSSEEVQQLYDAGIQALARIPIESRNLEQRMRLDAAYRNTDELLLRLEHQLDLLEAASREARWEGVRRWYVNGQGITMLVIPNTEEYGRKGVDHNFAISSHETTVAEFRRFQPEYAFDPAFSPTEDCPVYATDWLMAAGYCNWLSLQEGIPEDQWVYRPSDLSIKENPLALTGYRLPTEAEWEYACRAGTTSTCSFGEPIDLLERYCWYGPNSSGFAHPVESLLPNEAGCFDLIGNLWERVLNPDVLRGGSHNSVAVSAQSASMNLVDPSIRTTSYGFRVARTVSAR